MQFERAQSGRPWILDAERICPRHSGARSDLWSYEQLDGVADRFAKFFLGGSIDAGGLGVLLGLREWARSNAIMFKLMNAGNKVEQVLELTRLDRVFESCSVRDLFCLLRRAAAMPPWSVDESNPADAEANCNPSVLGRESVPAC